jgi:haloacetate dehalogenase
MFEHFTQGEKIVNGVSINYRVGGNGPGLLLLHGHPQTHTLWHKVAPELARHFTVVASDLRGYGDSGKIAPTADHSSYSKREMSKDQAELMRALGFPRFSVLAHDRGARVAHRLAADHKESVERMVLLDIAPTLAMYRQTSEGFARAYWHWFALIQAAPLPETLLGEHPELYIRNVMGGRSAGMKPFTQEALAEYIRCLGKPGTAQAICEDYRASAGIDLIHDEKDREEGLRLSCPLLVLWGERGIIAKFFNPLEEWEKVAREVRGKALPCGHYIAEEEPEILLREALPFLRGK